MFQVLDFGVPEKDNKSANNIPGMQDILWHEIKNQERHHLCKAFEMLPNQAAMVLANILSIHTWCIEAVPVDRGQTSLKKKSKPWNTS
jgi:hypothetical protein